MSTVQTGQLIPGSLPDPNCYPASAQAFYNLMFSLGSVQFPGLTGVIIDNNQPAATDRDKLWIKTSGGAPLWPIGYVYFNAQWVSRHPVPPSGSERRLWVGTEADVATYDGGDGSAPGQASGPMWEVDHTFDGRMPIGPGTVPSTSAPVVTVANGATGGEGQHLLTVAELPSHTHPPLTTANGGTFLIEQTGGSSSTTPSGTGTFPRDATTGATGGDQPHNNLPPYVGTFFIKRTARVYYRGA